MWAYVVAATTRVVKIVAHVERDLYLARLVCLGHTVVTKQARWFGRLTSDDGVRVELLIAGRIVTLEAVIGRMARRSIAKKARILETVLNACVLALVHDVVTGRTNNLSALNPDLQALVD